MDKAPEDRRLPTDLRPATLRHPALRFIAEWGGLVFGLFGVVVLLAMLAR